MPAAFSQNPFINDSLQHAVTIIKPYKIVTSGSQITIKSSRNIKNVMVWTSSGHRVIEQRDINSSSFDFKSPSREKFYFLMVQMNDGKVYTEKFGIDN
jgi:hypothetical protein